jgi:hypothetical protein
MILRRILGIVVLTLPLLFLGMPAGSQSTKFTSHTVVKTKGSVKISRNGEKSVINVDLEKNSGETKSYTVEGDYEIVTHGAIRESTVAGRHTVEVFPASEVKSGDCSGACCLAGNDQIGYRCLHPICNSKGGCNFHGGNGNRYCSC